MMMALIWATVLLTGFGGFSLGYGFGIGGNDPHSAAPGVSGLFMLICAGLLTCALSHFAPG